MRLPTTLATAALTVPLLLALSACTKESERAADRTSAATASSTATETASGAPSESGGGATYPSFGPQDYTYHLEVLCFCPQRGTVEVVVQHGRVTKATVLDGQLAGTPAPEFTRLTIDDIIEQANSPAAAKVKVDWPAGQDHPSSVMVDRIAQAVDDEVTYTIENVQVTPEG